MIINYIKYFKDNFDLNFHFEDENIFHLVIFKKSENQPLISCFYKISSIIRSCFNSKVLSIYDCNNKQIVYHRKNFISQRTLTIWKIFVKKKKCNRYNRLGLKMLKVVSEHLGNPIFMDFSV